MQREAEVSAGRPVGSGLSTTFTPMSHWITDRLPTEADGDPDGVLIVSTEDGWAFDIWKYVKPGTAWLSFRRPGIAPRRFVSVTRTVLQSGLHTIDAVADDGTAWWRVAGEKDGWNQLPPLPAPELTRDA